MSISASGPKACSPAHSDADARLRVQPRDIDFERLFEGVRDAFAQGQGRFRVGDVRAHDEELVASDSPDDVTGTNGVSYPRGDGDEQGVADDMTELVVDVLEVVEVDEDHRGVRTGSVEYLVQRRHRRRPIDAAGEAVEGRPQLELGAHPRRVRDVREAPDGSAHGSVRSRQRAEGQRAQRRRCRRAG